MKADSVSQEECDVVVPRSRIAEYVKAAKRIALSHGHPGGALRPLRRRQHPYGDAAGYAAMSDEEWKSATHASLKELYALSKELGGQLSGRARHRKRPAGVPGGVCGAPE